MSKELKRRRSQYFAQQMQRLPEPKPPAQIIQVYPGAHLTRIVRLVEVISTATHTPKDEHKREIHLATVKGLRQLLSTRCHGMTVSQMEDYLFGEVPKSADKTRVIRFALYAIDRHVRKELHLAELHAERQLKKQASHHPHN